MPIKNFYAGMGQAVAERTILRKKADGSFESWTDVANRVALGNSLLCKNKKEQKAEFRLLKKHLENASILLSGRHLQHGDETQPTRNMEVFTNCSTSSNTFSLFYLLLNGSGVGRCYNDNMMLVDWDNAPNLRCVLSEQHPDFIWGQHESVREAKHKYREGRDVLWHNVGDSREGWAKAVELWENAAFEKIHKDKLLILDFSEIRSKGTLIAGMQNRPASGPIPLMNAFLKASTVKGAKLPGWKQTMFIDHCFAECVLVGGARRAARMATKDWLDKSIFDFIQVKRPIEFLNKSSEEVTALRKNNNFWGFLWSANNSVTVDDYFWTLVTLDTDNLYYYSKDAKHARKVFNMITECAYADGTGEPGIINQDKLAVNKTGLEKLADGLYIGSKKYSINEDTVIYLRKLYKKQLQQDHSMIVNPCSEVPLHLLGGYCVIGDVVPFHCDTLEEAEEAFRVTTRALIRTNTLDSLYNKEVKRTNRIGVSITGIHEFAWKFFKYGFKDLLNEEKSKDFWLVLKRFNKAVNDEAKNYSKKLGLTIPHTNTTVKPAGTTSKLFGLSEGWHLPAMAWFLRWVQFRNDDPLVKMYKEYGYPTKELKQYEGTTIIGFPTAPIITNLGLEDRLVTASEASPNEQYKWLQLGEKYWINGSDTYDETTSKGSQISYTLKYDPKKISLEQFRDIIIKYQSSVKCCAIMPKEDITSYEYTPEQSLTKIEYEKLLHSIQKEVKEDINFEHLDCGTSSCPIDFNEGK